jgi:hypothetical protein
MFIKSRCAQKNMDALETFQILIQRGKKSTISKVHSKGHFQCFIREEKVHNFLCNL